MKDTPPSKKKWQMCRTRLSTDMGGVETTEYTTKQGDLWFWHLSIPEWVSEFSVASQRKKRPHTFLFERAPGRLGGTQTPFGTSCNLHATSGKGGPPLVTRLRKPVLHFHGHSLSTSIYWAWRYMPVPNTGKVEAEGSRSQSLSSMTNPSLT